MFPLETTWNKSHWKRSETISLLIVTYIFKFYMNKNKHLKGSTEFCKVNYDLTFIKQNTTNIFSYTVWVLWSFSVGTVGIFIKKGQKSNSQQWHKNNYWKGLLIYQNFKLHLAPLIFNLSRNDDFTSSFLN